MKATVDWQLPYPEDIDPANGALQLQMLAEAVDASLVAQRAAYSAAINKECALYQVGSDSIALISTSQIAFDTEIYSTGALSTASLISFPEGCRPGIYFMGTHVFSVQSAPTLNVVRKVTLRLELAQESTLLPASVATFDSYTYESNTGGEYNCLSILARVPNPEDSSFEVAYTQSASNLTVIKAGSLMWLYRVSDLD